jgi:hypothetical protein
MRKPMMTITSLGAFALAAVAVTNALAAEPEMRCRVDGAYIKLYAKDAAEQREICDRQGGVMTQYTPESNYGGVTPPNDGFAPGKNRMPKQGAGVFMR